jgi:DNA repair photolyase
MEERVRSMKIIYKPSGKALEYAPLALNLYAGCSHGCLYCYAPTSLHRDRAEFHASVTPRTNWREKVQADAIYLRRNNNNLPILLSFGCDPYPPIESELGITRTAIAILKCCGQHVNILTKGAELAVRDFDLLDAQDAFAVTMTFTTVKKSMQWEPLASAPYQRLNALITAHARGIPTWVSLEPVIEPAESLEIIRLTHPHVDLYKIGKLNYHPLANTIDWRKFALDAIALCDKYGKAYYIKKDLAKYMEEGK